MSEPQPQNVEPIPYWQQPSPRPTALTVIAIIGIVYASLGLLCQAFGLVSLSMFRAMPEMAANMPKPDAFTTAFQYFNMSVGIALSIPLLLASIGALYLKPIARPVLMVWSMLAIQFVTTRLIVGVAWIIPRTVMPTSMPTAMSPAAMHGLSVISAVVTWLITVALPIAMLIILTRPRVRSAFEKSQSSP